MPPILQRQMLPDTPAAPAQPGQVSPQDQVSLQETLLAQMSDVITPEPVGLWPPAPGWWLLGILLCALIGFSIFTLWRYRRQNRYKKFAFAELEAIKRSDDKYSNTQLAQAVNAVLKKTALNAYPHSRHRLAALYGGAWLDFLDHALKKPAPQKPDKSWINKMYQPYADSESIDRIALQHYARHWVKHHARLSPLQIDVLLNDGTAPVQPNLSPLQQREASYV